MVNETAFPNLSTIEKCVVSGDSFILIFPSFISDDGVFIVQFLYMKSIMENIAFDQIYHEHLLYYRIENLNFL